MTPLFTFYSLGHQKLGRRFVLKEHLKKYIPSIILATICSLVLGVVSTALFSLIGPALQLLLSPEVKQLSFDQLFGDRIGAALASLLGYSTVQASVLWENLPFLILILGAARAGFIASGWFLWERTSEKLAASIRESLVNAYLHLEPHSTYENEGFDQKLSSILTTDVKLTREYVVHFYGGLPRELFQSVFYLISIYLLSPKLFMIFMLGLLPAGLIISKLGKKIRKRSASALSQFSQLSEWLQQRLMGIETIKQLHSEAREVSKLSELTEDLNKKFLKTVRVKARTTPILEIVAVSAMVVILFLALEMVVKGEASGAILMSFFSLLGILSQSISKLGRYYNSNKEGGAALKRISDLKGFMDSNLSNEIPVYKHKNNSVLRLDDVSLTYPGQDYPALSNITYDFEKGKIYCLAGPSGAGKSSLFSVLLGLVEPSSGLLSFHENLSRSDVGYLPQNMNLAPTSLSENISYPFAKFNEGGISHALEAAAARDLKEKVVIDEGEHSREGLSGGQLQRLFLARLFYLKHPVVLIDEGTSAIDPENEAQIYQSIKKLAGQGATVIMIAHRQSGILIADEIIRLENGMLV